MSETKYPFPESERRAKLKRVAMRRRHPKVATALELAATAGIAGVAGYVLGAMANDEQRAALIAALERLAELDKPQ